MIWWWIVTKETPTKQIYVEGSQSFCCEWQKDIEISSGTGSFVMNQEKTLATSALSPMLVHSLNWLDSCVQNTCVFICVFKCAMCEIAKVRWKCFSEASSARCPDEIAVQENLRASSKVSSAIPYGQG